MITSAAARRYFNDNVLTFVIGICEVCYKRDVRICARCTFCAAIAAFRVTRFHESDIIPPKRTLNAICRSSSSCHVAAMSSKNFLPGAPLP